MLKSKQGMGRFHLHTIHVKGGVWSVMVPRFLCEFELESDHEHLMTPRRKGNRT